jgi:hypothetical protein
MCQNNKEGKDSKNNENNKKAINRNNKNNEEENNKKIGINTIGQSCDRPNQTATFNKHNTIPSII